MDRAAQVARLEVLLERLHALELHVPLPHERAVHEVAKAAVEVEVRGVGRRLAEGAYWRGWPRREVASA